MVNAGRVLIIPKGAWTNLTPYEMLDLVSEGDKAYLARQASVGVRPSEDSNMTYWQPFGSSASIATTDTPGLVMPDGVTITVDATGLIVANLNVSDLKDIKLTSLANGDVLKFDGTQSKWVNVALGTAAYKASTNAVTQNSTDLVESGAVYAEVNSLSQALVNKADSSTVSTLSGKAYQTDDAEESEVDDADYIPFYDTSASAKKKIKVENLNLSGESGGSIINVTTEETDLYGKTVTVTDGYLTFQSTINSSGKATIEGVTITGELTVRATGTSDTAEEVISVPYFGAYNVNLKFYRVYGFHVNASVSSPSNAVSYQVSYNGERVENYDYESAYMDFNNDVWKWGSWTGDEFFTPKPVLIKQDYSDKIYLNPNDYTKDVDGNDVSAILTGSTDGYNAMMEWGKNGKKIWYKLVPDSTPTSYTCFIANKQLDSDFKAWSFYDANNVLGEHFYTSIYNGSTVGSALRSLSGKTPNNTEAGATQITRAKANNKKGETYAWYIDVYADRVLINLLLILIIKSLNSDVVGYGNYTGGTAASSLLTTGQGNTKGMFYGKQSNGVVKVFGMENWFANCWRRMAGLILNSGALKYKLTYGTADGSSAAGYREDDNAPTNYLSGNSISTSLSSSYISTETAKTDGSLLPSGFSGANGTYYSDACWSSTGVRYALSGGNCANGSACGAFALALNGALSVSYWNVGAALSLKPLAE